MSRLAQAISWVVALLGVLLVPSIDAMEIVTDGKPVATIVTANGKLLERGPWGGKRATLSDDVAAYVLVQWIEKITDIKLPVATEPQADLAAIYIGETAKAQGLRLDDIKSPTNEGIRIVVKGKTALIGGQDGQSTVRAVCRFLERLGCRYYLDSGYPDYHSLNVEPMGQVYPRTKNLTVDDFEHTEMPKVMYRSIWGSSFYKPSLWRLWNGDGGKPMSMGHCWNLYVPKAQYFEEHPEYFTLRNGVRNGNVEWLCTTNPEAIDIFVNRILEWAEKNPEGSFSLSPPDNREYCECDKCRALDDPKHIVESSGKVSVTERYLVFFDEIARRVYKKYPRVTLNFYAYADYTEPPLPGKRKKLSPNLVAWIAPIRYSRYHHIGNPISPTRMEMKKVVDGWAEVVDKIAYRTYNFNLAESTVPFSKMLTWKHDFPYLYERGLVGVNNETFAAWGLMTPHMYQSARLMYDPTADSDAMMEEFFLKFYGAKAGPVMKEYWMEIDNAFQNLKSESGCYFALHLVYTPERLTKLQGLLDKAAKLTTDDEWLNRRVAMNNKGLQMAWDYMKFRELLNRGELAEAEKVAYGMMERCNSDFFCFHGKTREYLRRFIIPIAEFGDALTQPPNKMVYQFPDEWQMTYDPELVGLEKGYFKTKFDDSDWYKVKTYSATITEQGFPERQTWMWYRSKFPAPETFQQLLVFFADADGAPQTMKVYVNGKLVKARAHQDESSLEPNRQMRQEGVGNWKRRKPLWALIDSKYVKKGKENTIAVLMDHSSISENKLGGICRPVFLIDVHPEGNYPDYGFKEK